MISSKYSLKFLMSALSGLALAWLTLVSPAPTLGAAASHTLSLHFIRSADCTGELVEISGTIHLVSQIKADGSVVGHFNYQDVTGVGLTSGSVYRASAVDHFRLSAPFPSSITSTRSFYLINRPPIWLRWCKTLLVGLVGPVATPWSSSSPAVVNVPPAFDDVSAAASLHVEYTP
jgi:hypothetical protein